MTLKKHKIIWPIKLGCATALLATAIIMTDASTAQETPAPSSDEQTFPSIDSIRETIRNLQSRISSYKENLPATPEALTTLRGEVIEQLDAITVMQRDLGVEPETDEIANVSPGLQEDLVAAEEEISLLKLQNEIIENLQLKEREEAATKIKQLEDVVELNASKINEMETVLKAADVALAEATRPLRDPADVARIEEMEARLERASVEVAQLNTRSETMRLNLTSCGMALDNAKARAELPQAKAWQALKTQNENLQSENSINNVRLAEAMAITERCVGQTGDQDDRLLQALRQIEALEDALARERAALQ